MPCPFFHPDVPIPNDPWSRPPRMPLGEAYGGVCRASATAFIPDGDLLLSVCNRGYGRSSCPRFPADAEADAIRFSLAEERDGEVELIYVRERDYAPVAHGRAIYTIACDEVSGLDGIGAAQAVAFTTSY